MSSKATDGPTKVPMDTILHRLANELDVDMSDAPKPVPNRDAILNPAPQRPPAPPIIHVEDLTQTLMERGKRYGPFIGHAKVTQRLKRVINEELAARDVVLGDDQQEALEMIVHKIGRIVNGDPDYHDSWVDIAGYAQLVADRLKGIVR